MAGYLGFIGLYFGIMVAVYAILSVQYLRTEELSTRAETILAAAVSRTQWLTAWTVVSALGSLFLMVLAGVGSAAGAAITGVGDWELYGETVLGHIIQVAPVWLLLSFATALYGLLPRAMGAAWALFGYGTFMSLFGQIMQLGSPWQDLSPFSHVGQYPGAEISWASFATLTGLSVVFIVVGTVGFRRRDLITA